MIVTLHQRIALAAIVTEIVELPVEVEDSKGRKFEHSILLTIMRDATRAKSGFMILNHDKCANSEINGRRSCVQPYFENARYFVSKGYAVFLPLWVESYGKNRRTRRRSPRGAAGEQGFASCSAGEAGASPKPSRQICRREKTRLTLIPTTASSSGQSFGGTIAAAIAEATGHSWRQSGHQLRRRRRWQSRDPARAAVPARPPRGSLWWLWRDRAHPDTLALQRE